MEALTEHSQSPGQTKLRVCSAKLVLTQPSVALEEAHLGAFRQASLRASVCCSVQWAQGQLSAPSPCLGSHSLGVRWLVMVTPSGGPAAWGPRFWVAGLCSVQLRLASPGTTSAVSPILCPGKVSLRLCHLWRHQGHGGTEGRGDRSDILVIWFPAHGRSLGPHAASSEDQSRCHVKNSYFPKQ